MKTNARPMTIKDIQNKVYKLQGLSIAQTEYIYSLIELAYQLGLEKGKRKEELRGGEI